MKYNITYYLDIYSYIGSYVITTEYGKRSFKNYGRLVAKEGRKKNKDGMKNILIKEAN